MSVLIRPPQKRLLLLLQQHHKKISIFRQQQHASSSSSSSSSSLHGLVAAKRQLPVSIQWGQAGTAATLLLPQRQRQRSRSSSSVPIDASVIEEQLLLLSSSSSSGPLSSSPSPAALQPGDLVAPLPPPPSSSEPRKRERRRKKAAKEAKEVKEAQQQETPSSSAPTSNDEHSPAQANPEKQQQQHKKRRKKKTSTRQPKTDAASPAALAEKVIADWETEEKLAAAEVLVQDVRIYRFYDRKVFLDNVPETVTARDLLKIFSGLGGAGKVDAVVLLEAARAPEQKRMLRTDPRRIWGGGPRTAIIQLGDKETYDRALTDDMKIFGICWQRHVYKPTRKVGRNLFYTLQTGAFEIVDTFGPFALPPSPRSREEKKSPPSTRSLSDVVLEDDEEEKNEGGDKEEKQET